MKHSLRSGLVLALGVLGVIVCVVPVAKAQVKVADVSETTLLNDLDRELAKIGSRLTVFDIKVLKRNVQQSTDALFLEQNHTRALEYAHEAREYVENLRTHPSLATRLLLVSKLYLLESYVRSFAESCTKVDKIYTDEVYTKALSDVLKANSRLWNALQQFVTEAVSVMRDADSSLLARQTTKPR
jgi:DNA primase